MIEEVSEDGTSVTTQEEKMPTVANEEFDDEFRVCVVFWLEE